MTGKAEDGKLARLAGRLDYAFLKLDSMATVTGLRLVVKDMQGYGFRSLCLQPVLAGTVKKNFPDIRVTAVASYPLGGDSLASKLFAVQELIEHGGDGGPERRGKHGPGVARSATGLEARRAAPGRAGLPWVRRVHSTPRSNAVAGPRGPATA